MKNIFKYLVKSPRKPCLRICICVKGILSKNKKLLNQVKYSKDKLQKQLAKPYAKKESHRNSKLWNKP